MGKRYIFPFALAFFLTLIVTAPAALLDHWLQRATQNRLVLANGNGTLWNGSGTLALRAQGDQFIALQSLRWSVNWASIFTGHLAVKLNWDNLTNAPATDAILSAGQIELRHVSLSLPVHALNEISPLLKPAQFHGQFQVQADDLILDSQGIKGNATVEWLQAGSKLSSVDPLGNYRITLNGQGNTINIGLGTTSGALKLSGQGSWAIGRGLTFQGTAEAAPENRESLAELLHNLGPELRPNVHSFNLMPQ
jgi:general secretion pathway protein N